MSGVHRLGPLRTRVAPERLDTVAITDRQRRVTHAVASHLLDYPDAAQAARIPQLEELVAELPDAVAAPLTRFLSGYHAMHPSERQREYVSTFDLRRKCSLYLSYYAAGDTRRRGMALVTFQEAYRAAGWEFGADELPDFLPVVLEFSALAESPIAAQLLAAHREGMEVLRAALREYDSPYAAIMEAVCLTLPAIDDATRERYLALINEGPPTETVGVSFLGQLQPYSATDPNRKELRT